MIESEQRYTFGKKTHKDKKRKENPKPGYGKEDHRSERGGSQYNKK